MRTLLKFFITGILLCSVAFGQDSTVVLDWTMYFKKIENADSLYKAKQYQASAQAYSAAFAFNNQDFSVGNKYQAARAWAMTGNKDSAFANLKTEIGAGYHDYKQVVTEEAFQTLKGDAIWKKLVNGVKYNQQKEDKKLGKYKTVKMRLEKIYILDQKYRQDYMDTLKKYSEGSKEFTTLERQIHRVDKANLKYVSKTIDKYGWISYDTIGYDANEALFLVIQHADSATQEKYLPYLRNAAEQKRAFPADLALLEDRVSIKHGEKQIYGSQIRCDGSGLKCLVLPIADEKNVDKRRKALGMQPLAVYLKHFGIDYKNPTPD